MIIKIHKQLLLTSLISLMVWGCGSSPEYITAKMGIEKADWVQAEEYLVKALEVEPDNPEIPIQLGYHIYAKQGNWAQMNEIFERALKIDPDAKVTISSQTRPVREHVEQFRYRFWMESYNKGIVNYNKWKQSRNKTDLQSAVTAFETASKANPNESQTFSVLATSYLESGQNDLAVQNGKKAVELMPNDFNTNFTLSQILYRLGQKEESLPYIEKAVELNQSNSNAIRYLANVYYELNEKEKSVKTFEKAIEFETDKIQKANLYFNLGVLNKQLNNFSDAEIAFEEAFYLNEKDYEAVRGMAEAYEELGDNYFNGEDGFEKDPARAARWYRKAEKKVKSLMNIDIDNESTYKKDIELLRYKRGIAEKN